MSVTLTRWSAARTATVAGLIVATLGIALMKLGGAEMPPVPPGAVLMLLAAALVTATPARWAAAPAVLIALAELVATTLTLPDLGESPAGTITRLIGALTALCAAATTLTRRP